MLPWVKTWFCVRYHPHAIHRANILERKHRANVIKNRRGLARIAEDPKGHVV